MADAVHTASGIVVATSNNDLISYFDGYIHEYEKTNPKRAWIRAIFSQYALGEIDPKEAVQIVEQYLFNPRPVGAYSGSELKNDILELKFWVGNRYPESFILFLEENERIKNFINNE